MASETLKSDEAALINAESGDKFEDRPGSPSNASNHSTHSNHGSFDHHDLHFLIPSPTPTRRNRTQSASERAATAPVSHGKIKYFCRQKGHGFITPDAGGESIFVHISDIDGDTVPKEGDEVIYKVVPMPPKMERIQAVHVQIIAMKPGVKHDHWENTTIKE